MAMKQNALFISDFNYKSLIEDIKKKVPQFSRKLFMLYPEVQKWGDLSYWMPKAPKDIEKRLNQWLDEAKSHNMEGVSSYNGCSGGLFIHMEIDADNLEIEIGVKFEETFFTTERAIKC